MTSRKVLITGAGGMLAAAVQTAISPVCTVVSLTKAQLDITNKDAVIQTVHSIRPDAIVNTAAYTDTDKCEAQQDVAAQINGTAVGYIAQAVQMTGAKLIHISTDYVFDGEKSGPYTEEDHPNPISVYGQSKLKGEQELVRFTDDYVIIRMQWMFGEHGRNFVKAIIHGAETQKEIHVVDDQYGNPTYTKDVAEIIKWFIENGSIKGQIFHFSNEGIVSRFGFAQEILKLAGIQIRLVPVTSEVLNRPARRPHNSTLDKTKIKKLTGMSIRSWQDALYEYMKNAQYIR